MKTEANDKSREEKFTEFLEGLYERDERAALAALRRGLGRAPGEASEMHRYIVPRVQGLKEWREDAYYIVAALFALHPGKSWRAGGDTRHDTNLGASLGVLAKENKESSSVERRFVALLNCRKEELPDHLRNIVSLLKSKDIPINWAQLIKDINFWNNENRRVQRDWARAFWSDAAEAENDMGTVSSTHDAQTINGASIAE